MNLSSIELGAGTPVTTTAVSQLCRPERPSGSRVSDAAPAAQGADDGSSGFSGLASMDSPWAAV